MSIAAFLFGVKIIWNIGVPFELARFAFRGNTSSISMLPFVEIFLLLVLVLLSAFSSGSAWFNRPMQVALWGSVAIVGSYVLFFILRRPLIWLALQLKKRADKRRRQIKL